MKINKIKLVNFKCFERVEVDCAKITLLTGANSSGKSSILNGLLGAYQTTRYPFFYSPNGDYVNMGDYSEVSFGHVRGREIDIAFEIDPGDGSVTSFETRFFEDPKIRQPKLKSLRFTSAAFGLTLDAVKSRYEGSYSYAPSGMTGDAKAAAEVRALMNKFVWEMHSVTRKNPASFKKARRFGNPDISRQVLEASEGKVTLSSQFEVSVPEEYKFIVEFEIQTMANLFSQLNAQFNYISSFRHPPERTYYRRTKGALKVGRYGENHIDQLIEWEQSKSKKFRIFVKALQEMKLLSQIYTKTFAGGRFDIKVKPNNASVDTSLIDVGFGVSQFLPIIVADLQLPNGATMAISQPEIHLHPSAQSLLGEYFSKSVVDNEKRYIIETHSEYLINKFRALIAKGNLKPEDVSVYFLRKTSDRSETFRITFTKDGKIEGAPQDFFDTYMSDVLEIALST